MKSTIILMGMVGLLPVLLSFGAIDALVPLLIIIILIGAAAGLTRGWDAFKFLGMDFIGGIGTAAFGGKKGISTAVRKSTTGMLQKPAASPYQKTIKTIHETLLGKAGPPSQGGTPGLLRGLFTSTPPGRWQVGPKSMKSGYKNLLSANIYTKLTGNVSARESHGMVRKAVNDALFVGITSSRRLVSTQRALNRAIATRNNPSAIQAEKDAAEKEVQKLESRIAVIKGAAGIIEPTTAKEIEKVAEQYEENRNAILDKRSKELIYGHYEQLLGDPGLTDAAVASTTKYTEFVEGRGLVEKSRFESVSDLRKEVEKLEMEINEAKRNKVEERPTSVADELKERVKDETTRLRAMTGGMAGGAVSEGWIVKKAVGFEKEITPLADIVDLAGKIKGAEQGRALYGHVLPTEETIKGWLTTSTNTEAQRLSRQGTEEIVSALEKTHTKSQVNAKYLADVIGLKEEEVNREAAAIAMLVFTGGILGAAALSHRLLGLFERKRMSMSAKEQLGY